MATTTVAINARGMRTLVRSFKLSILMSSLETSVPSLAARHKPLEGRVVSSSGVLVRIPD
jgi:hypothetical protein